ncbi:MAG: tetratricopeptide repeat protein [Cyclobacteriaceae bacterium]
MKGLITFTLMLVLLTDPTKIGKINTLKAEAKKAYLAGDYKTAVQKYRYLIDSLQVKEDEVMLNLANAYFQLNDSTNALSEYQSLTQSSKHQLRSKAQQQLGVMSNRQGKFEEALNYFKESIKSDPSNNDARYNYELLKKKLEEKKKQEQQKQQQNQKDQNKEQENKDQEKQEQEKKEQQDKQEKQKEEQKKEQEKKDQQQEKKDQQKKDQQKKENEQQQEEQQKQDQEKQEPKETPPVSEKLKQMQISEEKAKMLLEAMKNQEIQYLQQNKRKATKPKDKSKPDW